MFLLRNKKNTDTFGLEKVPSAMVRHFLNLQIIASVIIAQDL